MRKIYISICLCILTLMTSGCSMSTREKIETGLKESLSVYPTKNLEDFYDKEGYRDSNFSKNDKGLWSIFTSVSRKDKEGLLRTESVILYIDRKTRTSEGYYFDEIDSKNFNKRYPIMMKNNKLILKDKNVEKRIKEKVENFKFLVQYGSFKNLGNYEEKNVIYNSEAPNYLISYKIKENDKNLKQIEKVFKVKGGKKSSFRIYGNSDLKSIPKASNKVMYIFEDNGYQSISSVVKFKSRGDLKNEYNNSN
ncbi:tandem-type lipoprotein [Staphylococcus hyicus]|uniref:tandem-type lipoprotein n=3 Tax=Staphylococcus hyicus TaxID=1284 RepID=UPI000581E45B|nr:tandem-type lipoprotein [Staphylococcus hyicus]AJC95084.1 staphylococcus tandem lipoprotein family protein [Staphylococcus hyicus]MCQ9300771.1 tandem-type lipoprotein [Staphylococcus hyicus]SQE46578.1 lipoprotein [Staphylococcus hyicus]